jgi:hypothetical protein
MANAVTESEVLRQGEGQKLCHLPPNSAQRKHLLIPLNFGDTPDGGTRAWLVAAGGSTVFFCCLGFSNAFGVFEEYYLTHQLREESPNKIAWIGSLSTFVQFAAGVVGGPLFDRFGAWVCHLAPLGVRDSPVI